MSIPAAATLHSPPPAAAVHAPPPGAIIAPPTQPATGGGLGATGGGFASAATLMALGRDRRILPQDFKIGPLGDEKSEKQDERRAFAAAGAFLDSVVAGNIDRDLFTPESSDAVADMLTFGLTHGNAPKSYRLGSPKSRENGEITAAVRLFGTEGTSEGVIYVAPVGSAWHVSDLQISLAQLSMRREKPKEKFFPLEYRWLLEE